MLGNWKIRANEPGDDLSVSIESQHPHHGNYFSATLKAKKIPLSRVSDPAVFFWLMPHKVAIWIYWHVSDLYSKSLQIHILKTLINLTAGFHTYSFRFLGT